jgi:hypothetical protein
MKQNKSLMISLIVNGARVDGRTYTKKCVSMHKLLLPHMHVGMSQRILFTSARMVYAYSRTDEYFCKISFTSTFRNTTEVAKAC